MLVIPAIELQDGRCLRMVASDDPFSVQVYSADPVQMALLWRKENARSLHITDYDAILGNPFNNLPTVQQIAAAVEIPIQLITRFQSIEQCRELLQSGIYRLTLHEQILRDPDGVSELLREYGPSRICASAISQGGNLFMIQHQGKPVPTLEFAALAESLGIRRLLFSDREYDGRLLGPNFAALRRLAEATSLQITAAGGVASVQDLWRLQEMRPLGIDSVVIGRAFYENRFPCQELWRDIEIERRKTGGSWVEEISTSRLRDT